MGTGGSQRLTDRELLLLDDGYAAPPSINAALAALWTAGPASHWRLPPAAWATSWWGHQWAAPACSSTVLAVLLLTTARVPLLRPSATWRSSCDGRPGRWPR